MMQYVLDTARTSPVINDRVNLVDLAYDCRSWLPFDFGNPFPTLYVLVANIAYWMLSQSGHLSWVCPPPSGPVSSDL